MIDEKEIIENTLIGEPYLVVGIGRIYPIEFKNYKKFLQLVKYIAFGKEYLKFPQEVKLLDGIIGMGILAVEQNEEMPITLDEVMKYSERTIEHLKQLLKLTTNKEFEYAYDTKIGSHFVCELNGSIIDDNAFALFREVVLKQNIQFEPIVYDDPIIEKWALKAKKARSKKNKSIDISEIFTILHCETGVSYKELSEYNLLQIYATYNRIMSIKNYERATLFQTVSDKVDGVSFNEGVIKELYKNPDADLFIDSGSSKLSQAL